MEEIEREYRSVKFESEDNKREIKSIKHENKILKIRLDSSNPIEVLLFIVI